MSPQRDNANQDKAADQPEAHTEAAAESAVPATASETPPSPPPSAAAAAAGGTRAGVSAGGAFVMGILGSVLVAGALGGIAYGTMPQWQPKVAALVVPGELAATAHRTAEQATALDGRVGALERTLGTLNDQLAQMQKAAAAPFSAGPAVAGGGTANSSHAESPRVDALAQRMAALETAPRFDPNQLAAVRQTVDGLTGEVAKVRKDVAQFQGLAAELKADNGTFKDDLKQSFGEFRQNSVSPAEVLKLSQRVDAAEISVREAHSRTQQTQALLIATGQLREAIYRGASFDAEFRALKIIAGDDGEILEVLQPLAPLADRGVVTQGELTSRFGELGSAIIRAEVVPDQPGWWRQTVQALASVVTVRRVDGEAAGESVAARVARARAGLDKGDVSIAVHELSALEGGPAEVAAPWLAKAQARLSAEQALSNLTAHAMAVAQAKG